MTRSSEKCEAAQLRTGIQNIIRSFGPKPSSVTTAATLLQELSVLLEKTPTHDSSYYLKEEEKHASFVHEYLVYDGPGKISINGEEQPASSADGRPCSYFIYKRPISDWEIKNGHLNQNPGVVPGPQDQWFNLRDRLGENEARAEIVRRLREAADQIEKKSFPNIFGAVIPPVGGKLVPETMQEISVILSHPWGG